MPVVITIQEPEVVRVIRHNGIAIVVRHESEPDNPRDSANLGKLCLPPMHHKECGESDYQNGVYLSVWRYQHHHIYLEARKREEPNPFTGWQHWKWDSCLQGFIVAFPQDILKFYNEKELTDELKEKVIARLKTEVENYGAYLDGKVYNYSVYKVANDVKDELVETEGELVNFASGFYKVADAVSLAEADYVPKGDFIEHGEIEEED